MDPERWARLKGLFEAAVEMPADERAAAVAAARAEDPQLGDELAALLAHDPEPTVGMPAALVAEAPPALPTRIDRYRILEEIGHGGMGRVFLAERADGAFRQRLAIKVLHAGVWAGEDVRRRFVAERQILARLTHPAIARLIDGGTAASGEPYLAMEYVEGKPIDDYCRDAGLDVDAVLRLVLRVCAAVESAHRSLVVHRDLKPSNILVTADGLPKLLDFGIAKLLDPELAGEVAVQTRHGHAPLTPRYAAPEQVRGEPVTVATDVYSLGVVLYELLTGESPYRVSSRDPLSFARAVVEQEPTPPSTAASRTGTSSTQPSGAATVTRALGRRLSADLDAIVLKALRKESEGRYGSMAELAADLERYLDGLPVEARRGSRLYRFGKLLRRRAVPLAAAAAFVALVVAFGVDRQLQLRRTAAERDRAQRVTEFLVDLFEQSDPSEARGNTVTVRETLDRGAARIDRELQAQPATRATLLDAVGRVYHNLGLYGRSGELLERATALRRNHGTREELAATLFHLARARQVAGDLAGAATAFQESAALSHAAGDRKAEAQATSELAQVRLDDGGYEEAAKLFTRATELRRTAGAVEPLDLGEDLAGLSIARQNSGDPTGAKSVIAEADGWLRQAKDPDPLRMAMVEGELAMSERGLGDVPAATVRLERAIARLRGVLPGDHGELANLLNTQAMLRADAGNLAGSITAFELSGAMWRRLVGEEHPRTALATSNLGVLYLRRGEWEKAEELIGRGLATARKTLPPDHPDLAIDLENLADAKLELGELDEAARLLAESEGIVAGGEKPSQRALARLHGRQARHLERRGELARAEELARSSLADYEATVAPESPAIPSAKLIIGRVVLARGRAAEALPLIESAVAARRKAMGEEHYETAAAKSLLAQALLETGDVARAQALLEEALPVQSAALAPWHFALAETRERLARALLARGDRERARTLLADAMQGLRAGFPNGHPLLPRLERELA
ncbi:MAG TPA: serine/threonine-protein kinase, partial [Thermoanaerobaculia bacterium]|nr:serine/threonine-protein kinase [Thermoanaerobaculia bacterium]